MSSNSATWDPWCAADERGVLVRIDAVADLLGGGFAVVWQGKEIVVLSPALDPAAQRSVLAHELIHLERGRALDDPEMPPTWAAVVAHEEQLVDDEAARRLVPAALLIDALHAGQTTSAELAAAFDVPVGVIERAARCAGVHRGLSDALDSAADGRSRHAC